MKFPGIWCAVLAASVVARGGEDFLDPVEQALAVSDAHAQFRARLSGTFDAAEYWLPQPVPALIFSDRRTLFSPRLTLFLDAQLGARWYLFAQGRADHGFDPGDDRAEARLDEYAIRFTPWNDGRLNLQVGKFATVVGSWVGRHGVWEDSFITAPLPYENLTGIWDAAGARSAASLHFWSHLWPVPFADPGYEDKYRQLPIIWGPSYATGASASGAVGRFDYAVELKNASLSSRPETWNGEPWHHPTISARLGFRPNVMWTFGLSASMGTYLRPEAARTLSPGEQLSDYRQTVLGQDAGFAWHRLQLWAELLESRFEIPGVGNADTVAGYLEARYQFAPRWFGALRWNWQTFRSLGPLGPWGAEVSRLDVGPEFRFTAHTELKLQYSLQEEAYQPRQRTHLVVAQFVLRF
jgi:hypothetical protein